MCVDSCLCAYVQPEQLCPYVLALLVFDHEAESYTALNILFIHTLTNCVTWTILLETQTKHKRNTSAHTPYTRARKGPPVQGGLAPTVRTVQNAGERQHLLLLPTSDTMVTHSTKEQGTCLDGRSELLQLDVNCRVVFFDLPTQSSALHET